MKNKCNFIKILIFIYSIFFIVESNTLEIKLFGTRRDVKFLSIEGDIFRPLMYEFEDRDLTFKSVDIDSSNNYDKYKSLINEAGGKSTLPFIMIDGTLIKTVDISKEKLRDIIDRRAFVKESKKPKSQDVKNKKVLKKYPVKSTTSKPIKNEDMVYTNIFVAIIVVIGAVVVYYARKNLLR